MKQINVQKLEPYEPPFSVWKFIEAQVPSKELPLVKSYIGESSIEYCVDLRNELEILLDIWKEVGNQIEPPIVTKSMVTSILPDPPQLKEMLTKEIQMLVKEIQEKNGTADEHKYEARDKKIIQYAMMTQTTELERPATPLRIPSSEACSSSTVKLKEVKRNISAFNIDAVADLLREAIQKECKQLERDIQFLQKSVEEEHEVLSSRPSSPIEEPSVLQLRQVCRTLELQALSQKNSPTTAPRQPTPPKRPTPPSPKRIQLKPIETKSLPSSSMRSSVTQFRQRLNSKTFDSASIEEILDEDCWFEPSWSVCMSDSLPPSTSDSGVSSRPGTCEISALRERRQLLANLDRASSPVITNTSNSTLDNHTANDVGYCTNSSSELTNFELNRLSVGESVKINSGPAFSVPVPPNSTSSAISPHPPKEDLMKLSRKNVSARRFTRKLVKTT